VRLLVWLQFQYRCITLLRNVAEHCTNKAVLTRTGPFKSSRVGTAFTCGQLAVLLWTAYVTLFGPRSSLDCLDCLDWLTAGVCLVRATVAQGETVRCLNRLHAVSQGQAPQAPHLLLAACVFLPVCIGQALATGGHSLLILLVLLTPVSVETVVALTQFALQRQFRGINTQLQNRERASGNPKQPSSWWLRATLRKLRVKWTRRRRSVCPVTSRVAIGGPLPWEVRAARSARFESHVSELVQQLRISHAHLCDAAGAINSRYGLEVLVVTAANFCKLVQALHGFIRDVIVRGEASNRLTAAMSTACALQLFRILWVCYSCEQVRSQVRSATVQDPVSATAVNRSALRYGAPLFRILCVCYSCEQVRSQVRGATVQDPVCLLQL
jgi:hypothetical protein